MEAPDPANQLQSLPHCYILVDPDQRIYSVNSSAENFLGQSASRLKGRKVYDVLQFEDQRLAKGLARPDTNIFARQMILRSDNIAPRRVDIGIAPVVRSEAWQVAIFVDSTTGPDFLSTEDTDGAGFALRAPEVLAHEIKNPLAGIKGAAQLLERRCEESDKALTRLITGEVERVAKLIDDMQSLSRRTSDPGEACNVHEVITRARTIVRIAHPEELQILDDFDPSLPPVFAVRDSLLQVVLNLMTNAAEACADAENPSITLSTKFASGIKLRLPDRDRMLELPIEIRISDNGAGIPADLRDHLFSPFVTSKSHGQGLGLALVQKLVRDMNGRIWHERDETAGLTRFRLFLPLADTVSKEPVA